MGLVRTLIDCDSPYAEPSLPQQLRGLYDGDLHFRGSGLGRPLVIANFVSTLDGVVSYGIKGKSGGSAISGSDCGDRFIMGLLRASVDAIIVGAGTLNDVSPKSLWTPEYVYPDAKRFYAEYRAIAPQKSEYPLLVLVSGSGQVDAERAIFHTPAMRAIVVTTSTGRDEIMRRGATSAASPEIDVLNSSGGSIAPDAILELLQSKYGVKTLLNEGGPTLFGQFLEAKDVDELFLTLAPKIAGRAEGGLRPGIVQGALFLPDSAPSFQMISVKEKGAHLYLRYRRQANGNAD